MAGCTVRAVAGVVGITPGAIYRHFANRDDLVLQAVNLALDRFEVRLLNAIASLPVGSLARIAALGETYIRFADEHEQEFRVLFMSSRRGHRLGGLFEKTGYPILRRCVIEAMRSGELREADSEMVTLYLWTRIHGIVTLFLACDVAEEIGLPEKLDPLAFFERTRHLVMAGLLPETP